MLAAVAIVRRRRRREERKGKEKNFLVNERQTGKDIEDFVSTELTPG